MIKIIKHGKKEPIIKRFTCPCCRCIFDASDDELESVFDRNETFYVCRCPECGYFVSIEV